MKRTNPPLTSAERQRRYMANHPEVREKNRLAMQAKRKVERQQRELERLALVLPKANDLDPAIQEKISALTAIKKIPTGLQEDDIPSVTAAET